MAKPEKVETQTISAADVGEVVETVLQEPKAKFVPKVKRHVTRPLIKPSIGVPIYIKVTSAMFIGKDISARDTSTEKKKAPATLVNCVNLETGEESQLIVPSVLKGIFEDEYPENAYVGLGFSVTKQQKREGKDYFPFSVAEIEV